MTDVTNFTSLLQAAEQHDEPQRLLFLFLKATEVSAQAGGEGQTGFLTPIMCVDKNLPELTTFEDLVAESQKMGPDWTLVLVTSLSGNGGEYPSTKITEQALDMMVRTVENGGDLSNFLAFDKSGSIVNFG